MTHNQISAIILEVAVDIHRRLGPGLLESVYQAVVGHELAKRGLRVEREVPIPVEWDGLLLNFGAALMKDGIHRIVNGLVESHAEAQWRREAELDSDYP
jgi:hypothetical protein